MELLRPTRPPLAVSYSNNIDRIFEARSSATGIPDDAINQGVPYRTWHGRDIRRRHATRNPKSAYAKLPR